MSAIRIGAGWLRRLGQAPWPADPDRSGGAWRRADRRRGVRGRSDTMVGEGLAAMSARVPAHDPDQWLATPAVDGRTVTVTGCALPPGAETRLDPSDRDLTLAAETGTSTIFTGIGQRLAATVKGVARAIEMNPTRFSNVVFGPAPIPDLPGSTRSGGAKPADLTLVLCPSCSGFLPLPALAWRISVIAMGEDEARAGGQDRTAAADRDSLRDARDRDGRGGVRHRRLGRAEGVAHGALPRGLGILTAPIGAPVLVWLLARGRREWA